MNSLSKQIFCNIFTGFCMVSTSVLPAFADGSGKSNSNQSKSIVFKILEANSKPERREEKVTAHKTTVNVQHTGVPAVDTIKKLCPKATFVHNITTTKTNSPGSTKDDPTSKPDPIARITHRADVSKSETPFFKILPTSYPKGLPEVPKDKTNFVNSFLQACSTSQRLRAQTATLIGKIYVDKVFSYIDGLCDEPDFYQDFANVFAEKVSPKDLSKYPMVNNLSLSQRVPWMQKIEYESCILSWDRRRHWRSIDELKQNKVTFVGKISNKVNGKTQDLKLKSILCYEKTGSDISYYVVRQYDGIWFKFKKEAIEPYIDLRGRTEDQILEELNKKYGTKILMAFYDYDPECKIGV